jgi:hypothetical protein
MVSGHPRPVLDPLRKLGEPSVVDLELVTRESGERAEHLDEDLGRKPPILLGSEVEKAGKAVAALDRREIDKVACFRTTEDRKHFVDRELLACQCRHDVVVIYREKTSVSAKVELRELVTPVDLEPREPGVLTDHRHLQASATERCLDHRDQPIHGLGRRPEEVEVPGLTRDVTADDQGSTPGKGEIGRLGLAGNDRRDLLLKAGKHY